MAIQVGLADDAAFRGRFTGALASSDIYPFRPARRGAMAAAGGRMQLAVALHRVTDQPNELRCGESRWEPGAPLPDWSRNRLLRGMGLRTIAPVQSTSASNLEVGPLASIEVNHAEAHFVNPSPGATLPPVSGTVLSVFDETALFRKRSVRIVQVWE